MLQVLRILVILIVANPGIPRYRAKEKGMLNPRKKGIPKGMPFRSYY